MAVMVTLTLKTEPATYRSLHDQMVALARGAGLLFHASYESGGHVGVLDFWPSEEAWNAFAQGPLAEGMKAVGMEPPDDLKVTPLIAADGA